MDKKIIYVMMFLVLGSFVAADYTAYSTVYNFEQDSTTSELIDQISNNDSFSHKANATVIGKNNLAWQFNASDDYVEIPLEILNGSTEGAMMCWVYFYTPSGDKRFWDNGQNTYFSFGAGGSPGANYMDGDMRLLTTGAEDTRLYGANGIKGGMFSNFTWYMIGFTYDGSSVHYIRNDTIAGSKTATGAINWANNMTLMSRTGDHTVGWAVNGMMDECYFYKNNLSTTDITTLFNSGLGTFYGDNKPATPSFEYPTPSNNQYNNSNQVINCSSSQTDVNYFMWFNNQMWINNETQTGDYYKLFNTNLTADGEYTYKCGLQNTTNGLFSSNISRTYNLDTTIPTINLLTTNSFKSNNQSIISNYLTNITINISFYDLNLYETSINITNSSGDIVYTNVSIASGNQINFSDKLNINNLSLGVYSVGLSATDTNYLQRSYANYTFQIGGVVNITAYDPLSNTQLNFTSQLFGQTLNSDISLSNSTQHENITAGTKHLIINADGGYIYNADININQSYLKLNIPLYKFNAIDDCSNYTNKVLTLGGKDEETDANVTTQLDITLFHTSYTNLSLSYNLSFIFRGQDNYSICTNTNQTFSIDSIMEYGDGTVYAKKKYYLNNYIANSTQENIVHLYHLNSSKASEITFTVYDDVTGDVVPSVFVKVLRYYPGENIYKIVEIVKTDELGKSIVKMVLADVFYKFILEKPAGTVKLSTDVVRMLSLVRSFGINFITNYLDTWDKINDVSISTTCTRSTKTCRVTWSDGSNIVQYVTFQVWRKTGLSDGLLYESKVSAAAGTIAYTITEDTTGNTYEAMSFIESNTGTSEYFAGMDSLFYSSNVFFADQESRIASLFPLLLLIVVIVFALIDFSAIGVTIGGIVGLLAGHFLGIMPLSAFYLVSFICMAAILIFKLSK